MSSRPLTPEQIKEFRELALKQEVTFKGELRIYADVVAEEMAERGLTREEYDRLRRPGCRTYMTLEAADVERLRLLKVAEAVKSGM